ncbi:ABC transporter permease [Clostridium rectalis]|uniref:ABC transporter permease n=1 Tax=Clostridium rectalis TaxID=2040295 RepID=UPI000F6310D8|nr:ABC transporter permease [Clostridium rectalis]
MKIIYIIFYKLKINLRNKKSLINMLLLPVILILILGTALKSDFTPGNIKRSKVYYCIKDEGELSNNFESYITSNKLKDLIEVKKVNSKEEGLNFIAVDERSSFIFIDKGTLANILSGKKSNIFLYSERDTIQKEIVKNVLNGFVNGANTMYASYTMGAKGGAIVDKNSIVDSSIDIHGKIPKAIDYYSVTMLVMTLMYGSLYGRYSIREIYEEEGIRVKNTPTKGIDILIGYITSSIVTVFLEGLLLMFIAKYIFKANYGKDIALIIFIIFSMSVFTNFIGMAVGTLVRKDDKSADILNIFIVACTLVSGGYVKFPINSNFYDKIIRFIPNGMAHNAMFNSIYGGNNEIIISNILAMWIGTALCLGVSLIAEKRRAI